MGSDFYGRSSKKYAQKHEYIDLYRKDRLDKIFENKNHFLYNILDSSLITPTPYETYSIKLIQCGNYIYTYNYGCEKKKKVKNIMPFRDKRKDLNRELNILEKKKEIENLNNVNNEINEKENRKKIVKRNEKNKNNENNELRKIDIKNINRSKYSLQMLIKANENIFKTFITLTFRDEITDIRIANKKFDSFKTMIKRAYKDFSYISVPEFQKNGRIHYHLLTNIDYDDVKLLNENISYCNLLFKMNENIYKISRFSSFKEKDLKFFFYKDEVEHRRSIHNIYSLCSHYKIKLRRINIWCIKNINKTYTLLSRKELIIKKRLAPSYNILSIVLRKQNNKLHNTKKTFNLKSKKYKVFKTLKYWNYGYSNVISIDNINIVAYLTKYLTKDIDERLFSFRRYTYSLNLKKPSITYLNLHYFDGFYKYFNLVVNFNPIYQYNYSTIYNDNIEFTEYKNKDLLNV